MTTWKQYSMVFIRFCSFIRIYHMPKFHPWFFSACGTNWQKREKTFAHFITRKLKVITSPLISSTVVYSLRKKSDSQIGPWACPCLAVVPGTLNSNHHLLSPSLPGHEEHASHFISVSRYQTSTVFLLLWNWHYIKLFLNIATSLLKKKHFDLEKLYKSESVRKVSKKIRKYRKNCERLKKLFKWEAMKQKTKKYWEIWNFSVFQQGNSYREREINQQLFHRGVRLKYGSFWNWQNLLNCWSV